MFNLKSSLGLAAVMLILGWVTPAHAHSNCSHGIAAHQHGQQQRACRGKHSFNAWAISSCGQQKVRGCNRCGHVQRQRHQHGSWQRVTVVRSECGTLRDVQRCNRHGCTHTREVRHRCNRQCRSSCANIRARANVGPQRGTAFVGNRQTHVRVGARNSHVRVGNRQSAVRIGTRQTVIRSGQNQFRTGPRQTTIRSGRNQLRVGPRQTNIRLGQRGGPQIRLRIPK